jgi:hypothetical protein
VNRRTFLCGLTLGTLSAPLGGEAQQAAKAARIGYLSATSAAADALYSEAFRQGLRALGYVEGQTSSLKPGMRTAVLKGFRISPRSSFVSKST